MNVFLVLEKNGSTPTLFFVDMDTCPPKYKAAMEAACRDSLKITEIDSLDSYSFGFQSHLWPGLVEPPCFVLDVLTIYTN